MEIEEEKEKMDGEHQKQQRQHILQQAARERAEHAKLMAAERQELDRMAGMGILFAQACALEMTFVQDRITRKIHKLTWHMPIHTKENLRQIEILHWMIKQYNENPFKIIGCPHPLGATVYCEYHKAWVCEMCFFEEHRGEQRV
jgi:acetate kinase